MRPWHERPRWQRVLIVLGALIATAAGIFMWAVVMYGAMYMMATTCQAGPC